MAKSDEKAKKKVNTDAKFHSKTKLFDLKRFDYMVQLKEWTGQHLGAQLNFTFMSALARKHVSMFHEISTKLNDKKQILDSITLQEAETAKLLYNQRKEWEEMRRGLERKASRNTILGPNTILSVTNTDGIKYNSDDSPSIEPLQTLSPALSIKMKKDVVDPQMNLSSTTVPIERKREGFLQVSIRHSVGTKSTSFASWKKVWCVLSNGHFHGISSYLIS